MARVVVQRACAAVLESISEEDSGTRAVALVIGGTYDVYSTNGCRNEKSLTLTHLLDLQHATIRQGIRDLKGSNECSQV